MYGLTWTPRGLTNLIWTSIYDETSGPMKITTHLDHTSHRETASGTNWLNRWTYQVFIMNTHRDYIGGLPDCLGRILALFHRVWLRQNDETASLLSSHGSRVFPTTELGGRIPRGAPREESDAGHPQALAQPDPLPFLRGAPNPKPYALNPKP